MSNCYLKSIGVCEKVFFEMDENRKKIVYKTD
jgi:hypothetical protein